MDLFNCNFINWNVRGLNSRAKRNVVREIVASSLASVACIQETKLDVIDSALWKSLDHPLMGSVTCWLLKLEVVYS